MQNVSILESKDAWTAAIVRHKWTWEENESQKFDIIQSRDVAEVYRKLGDVLGSYSVLRTLSKSPEVRKKLLKNIFATSIGGNPVRRYSEYAAHVRRIANEIGSQQDHGRPFSLVSKVMVHLYPRDGFIFDKNACIVLGKIAGRSFSGDTTQKFDRFVKDYWAIFGGLRKAMRGDYTHHPSLSHTIDKFLWICGSNNAARILKKELESADNQNRRDGDRIAKWFSKNPPSFKE